jgi:hypothetical protein
MSTELETGLENLRKVAAQHAGSGHAAQAWIVKKMAPCGADVSASGGVGKRAAER